MTQQLPTDTPLVSFILTYYNLPIDLLRRCIDSIKALTLRPCEREIILIDDGSTVSPLPYLADYQDDIVYIRQKNGGLSVARNTGIRIAQGQYLQFVDADDCLLTSAYEHCLDLVRYQHSDMVLFDFTEQPDSHATYDDTPAMSGATFLRTKNIRGTACGYLFRKSALSELRFTPGIYHEDEEFTPLLMLRADTVVSTNAKAYQYTRRSGSITTAPDIRHRLKRLDDLQQILFRLQRTTDSLPTEERLALSRRVHQLTMDYIYNVILLTRSRHFLNRKLEELHRRNIYPLPNREYTRKYNCFRRLANSGVGLSVLMRIIPLMRSER